MGKLISKYPRLCYENGNSAIGKEIFEFHATCNCVDCQNRNSIRKEPANSATATTKDISKVNEITEFLKNWTCQNGKKWLKTVYFQF